MPNYPAKPASYKLRPGFGLLKGVQDLVQAPASGAPPSGMTPEDKEIAENWAWDKLLSLFAVEYDPEPSWDYDPPPAFERIWDMLASAHYLRMLTEEHQVRDRTLVGPADRWTDMAVQWSKEIIAGTQELLKSDGTIMARRTDINVPEVRSSGTRFFPDLDTDTSHGETVAGTPEEVYKLATQRARTG